MNLQIGARYAEQREARGMRIGKSVQREQRDRRDDSLGGVAGNPLTRDPVAQLRFDLLMRRSERLKPMARRSSSAWPPVKPAATIAIRSSCS